MSREIKILFASTEHCLEATTLAARFSGCKRKKKKLTCQNCHSFLRIFFFLGGMKVAMGRRLTQVFSLHDFVIIWAITVLPNVQSSLCIWWLHFLLA